MSEPIWNKFLTVRDKQVFAASGFGVRQGFGKRPAAGYIARLAQDSVAYAGENSTS
jgi:hypothetical protein